METSSTTELESQTKAQRASHSMRSSPETESTRRRVPLLRRIREYRPRPQLVKDAVIGVADGIVVPFAVAAGLTSFGNAKLVVSGGMAELFAGAISMGLVRPAHAFRYPRR